MLFILRRGRSLLRPLLDLPGVEVPAVCDIDDNAAEAARKLATEAGKARPDAYSSGPEDYLRLLDRSDLEAIGLQGSPEEAVLRLLASRATLLGLLHEGERILRVADPVLREEAGWLDAAKDELSSEGGLPGYPASLLRTIEDLHVQAAHQSAVLLLVGDVRVDDLHQDDHVQPVLVLPAVAPGDEFMSGVPVTQRQHVGRVNGRLPQRPQGRDHHDRQRLLGLGQR